MLNEKPGIPFPPDNNQEVSPSPVQPVVSWAVLLEFNFTVKRSLVHFAFLHFEMRLGALIFHSLPKATWPWKSGIGQKGVFI